MASRPSLTWNAAGKPIPESKPAGEYLNVTFVNHRPETAELIWLGPDGARRSYATLRENETFSIRTRPGAVWLLEMVGENNDRQLLGHFLVEAKGKALQAVIPAP